MIEIQNVSFEYEKSQGTRDFAFNFFIYAFL